MENFFFLILPKSNDLALADCELPSLLGTGFCPDLRLVLAFFMILHFTLYIAGSQSRCNSLKGLPMNSPVIPLMNRITLQGDSHFALCKRGSEHANPMVSLAILDQDFPEFMGPFCEDFGIFDGLFKGSGLPKKAVVENIFDIQRSTRCR